jgi:hypothetical protein
MKTTDKINATIKRTRAKWYAAATRVGPVDQARAEAAAQAVRAAHGLGPGSVAWLESPQEFKSSPFWNSLDGSSWDVPSTSAGFGNGVFYPANLTMDSLWDSLWDSIVAPLTESLWDSIGNPLWPSIGPPLWNSFGPLDAPSVAMYECARELGVVYSAEDTTRLAAHAESVKACGIWWYFGDQIVMIQRPTQFHVEKKNRYGQVWIERLHCESGPAMAWADGYAIHARHGKIETT